MGCCLVWLAMVLFGLIWLGYFTVMGQAILRKGLKSIDGIDHFLQTVDAYLPRLLRQSLEFEFPSWQCGSDISIENFLR